MELPEVAVQVAPGGQAAAHELPVGEDGLELGRERLLVLEAS